MVSKQLTLLGRTQIIAVLTSFLLALNNKRSSFCHACTPGVHVLCPLAVGCLVRNDNNELLLVQDSDGKWTFPAGGVNFLESPRTAAARETNEEAGVTVEVGEAACGVKSFSFTSGLDLFTGYCCTENPTGQDPPSSDGSSEVVDAKYWDRTAVAGFSASELRFPEQQQLLLEVIDGNIC